MVIRAEVCTCMYPLSESFSQLRPALGTRNFFSSFSRNVLKDVCIVYALVDIYVCASMVYGHRGRVLGKKTETRAVRRDMPFVYVGGACTY